MARNRLETRPAERAENPEHEVLRETLKALELPAAGLAKFLSHNRAFCEKHGGRRVYNELLTLLDDCEAVLAEATPEEPR